MAGTVRVDGEEVVVDRVAPTTTGMTWLAYPKNRLKDGAFGFTEEEALKNLKEQMKKT